MVLSDMRKSGAQWKKWVVLVWAFLECLLFGGLLYGWGSVNYVLKNEGIYADLCDDQKTMNMTNNTISYNTITGGDKFNGSVNIVPLVTALPNVTGTPASQSNDSSKTADKADAECEPQDSRMALCFTIGSFLFCVGCAVLGQVNYKFGTRVTRIMSFLLFVTGSLLMAFISVGSPWLMYPGLSLLGIGGLPILVTNMQVSNLFITGSSSVVGLLCGGFDMSSSVMLMVKIAHENGFSRRNMFLVITALHSMLLVSTFFFLPKDFIPRIEAKSAPSDVAKEETEVGVELIHKTNGKGDSEVEVPPPTPSLFSCLKKPLLITHIVWLCILQLRFFYFIGTLNQYLTRTTDEVSYFTNVCYSTMMGGLLTSFFAGIVYDWQKWMCREGKSKMYREVMPAVLPLATASILSLLLSVLVLIPNENLLYVIFIVMTLCRSFLYSLAAAFLSAIFPSQYFGVLYGIMIVCGGVFGLNQYAFFKWAEAYPAGPMHADIFLLGLVLVSLIHPLYLWITCWKEERKFKIN